MKARKIAVLVAAAALLGAADAQAHVSIHPNTIPAGAFTTLNLVVPGEQQGAYVKKVDVLFPAGFTSVAYAVVPGWSVRTIERKLATPLKEDGEPIDTEVAQLIWTWTGPLGKVEDGQFAEFPLSVAIPDDAAGKPLEFRTVQTYSNGQAVHWIDPSLEAEHPSPRINVTAKGGASEDVAGAEAGPAAGQTAAAPVGAASRVGAAGSSTTEAGRASKGLALAALIVGVLALLVGVGAVALARRRGAQV
ncbi:MAG: YcnI family copper-binding membrane protein [Solirubrobacteraceae bacterium]